MHNHLSRAATILIAAGLAIGGAAAAQQVDRKPKPEPVAADSSGPKRLTAAEVQRRRHALAERIRPADRVGLETRGCRFDLDRGHGNWMLTDKSDGTQWTSDPAEPGFAQIRLSDGKQSATRPVDHFDRVETSADRLRLICRPEVDGRPSGVTATFSVEPTEVPDGVKISYESQSAGPWHVAAVRLLDRALAVTEDDEGVVYVPHRLGIEVPTANALPGSRQWVTGDDLSMAMCGLVKQHSALLVSWDDAGARLIVDAAWPDLDRVPGRRSRSVSLEIEAAQGDCTLHPLGRGDYVAIAKSYRAIAQAKGLRVTLPEKARKNPAVDRLAGAAIFALRMLSRVGVSKANNPLVADRKSGQSPAKHSTDVKEPLHVGYTFAEAAQCAEHWRLDLNVERASVVLAGAIKAGYDERKPGVAAAAPECGGTRGMAATALRLKACGYALSLRDGDLDARKEGRESTVASTDHLEGIFSHQTGSAPGSVIPLFPLVYGDCVALRTRSSDRVGPGDEKKIADHLLFAQMPAPAFGDHLYWKQPSPKPLRLMPLPPRVKDLGDRRFEITYRWSVEQALAADYTMLVHFTQKTGRDAERIVFQNDHVPKTPTSQWQPGIVDDGPYTVDVPETTDGPVEIRVGLRADGRRVALLHLVQDDLRYRVGQVWAAPEGIRFRPAVVKPSGDFWSRGETGWGEDLCPTDRVIKNIYEVFGPLNRMTAAVPMAEHEFLTPDRLLARTRFGDVTITVTYDKPARIGDNRIPAYGFIVKSPQFIAFCATRYNGVDYRLPAMFTARSLDDRPIAESLKVRIYHGFGDRHVRLFGKDFDVAREAIVRVK